MGEIRAGGHLLSIAEIVNRARKIGTGALLIVNNYISRLIWGIDSVYFFYSDSRHEYGNLSSSGTSVLLKFDYLNSLKSYIRSLYYNTFPQTLYFQVQFIKAQCSANTKTAIKCGLKNEQLAATRERDLDTKKDYNDPEKKRDVANNNNKRYITIKKNQ